VFKPIAGLPQNVIGFEAVGKVVADDYKNVFDPAVAKAAEANGKVRVLFVLGHDYASFSTGAMIQDGRAGAAERKAWDRIAVVSDHNHILGTIHAFAWMVPGDVRTYAMDQMDAAKAWLREA